MVKEFIYTLLLSMIMVEIVKPGTCYDDGLEKARFLKKLFDEEGVYTKDIYPFRTNKGCMSQKIERLCHRPPRRIV